jgi:GNAT superfamily N-acetyltransferase
MKIRNALKTDITEIIKLTRQLGYSVDENNFKHQFDNIIRNPGHAIFVAEDIDCNVIGYIHILPKELLISIASVEIGELIVNKNYRRKGIGKQLIEKVEQWAIENEYKSIIVGSSNKRVESHLFYPSVGYNYLKEQVLYCKVLKNGL